MKILTYMASLAIMCACTSTLTPEQQAQQVIKDFFAENTNDPQKYEPISFGTLDSTFTSYVASDRYKELDSLCDVYEAKYKAYMDKHNFDSAEVYMDMKHDIYRIMGEETDTYKGEHLGWKMEHKFRAANKLGALILDTKTFYLDKDLTQITTVK